MKLFGKRKHNKRTEFIPEQYLLPTTYSGSYKQLGDNVFLPWDLGTNGNVLVFGSAGSGRRCSYIEPNIRNTDHRSNCIVYINKTEAKSIIEHVTDRTILELDLSTHPIDYFSLITDKSDAERFVDKMFEAHESIFQEPSDGFYFDHERKILVDIVTSVLDHKETCNYQTILKILCEDTETWSETFRSLPDNIQESIICDLQIRIRDLAPDDAISLPDVIADIMHKPNTVLFVEHNGSEKTVYESVFLNEFVYRYKRRIDSDAVMTKVLMADAKDCFYDANLFCKEVRQIGMSIDFIYPSIAELQEQHPVCYQMIANNSAAIVYLVPTDNETMEFCTDLIGHGRKHMIDFHSLPAEYEIVLCPVLCKDPFVAKKIGTDI